LLYANLRFVLSLEKEPSQTIKSEVKSAFPNPVTEIIPSVLFLFTIEFPYKNAAITIAIEKMMDVKLFFIVLKFITL